MAIMENTYRPQRPAHDEVTPRAANKLFSDTGIDWPVSGDESRVSYGTIGMRRASQRVTIWNMKE